MRLALVLLYALAQAGSPSRSQLPPAWFDPFCAVSVQAETTAGGLSVVLFSQSANRIDAHLTLIGDDNAYDAFLQQVSLSGSQPALRSRPYLVLLPKAEAIHYAFVDSYAVGSSTTNCPSEPSEVTSPSAGTPVQRSPSSDRVIASFKQPIGPLKCGKPYEPPKLAGASEPIASGVDKPRSSFIMTFVNANGDIVKAYVWQSSGVDALDSAAAVAAERSRYTPGSLLCSPVAGSYLFRADFKP
ncbi:MAG TPA: hypothetical protein VHX17_04825 [Candidatus Cybelea sp.]|nr:hypothetical protein [Candidatus Cybelea sp.]